MSKTKLNDLAQGISLPVEGEKYDSPGSIDVIRRAGEESMVLLKNEDHAFPFQKDESVAIFGRCQINTFYTGYGSGGDVKPTRKISILKGIEESPIHYDKEVAETYKRWCAAHVPDNGSWGRWPFSYPEMPVSRRNVEAAAARNDKALVIIGRSAGEDRDNTLKRGSYYLTPEEEDLLAKADQCFKSVCVLLNIGNIIDFSWIKKYKHIKGLMIAWQLGQEMGYAVADVLSGRVSPSGHLAQTIAETYEDYPSSPYFGNRDANDYKERWHVGYRGVRHPLFPFGYGLSYTAFKVIPMTFSENKQGFEIGTEITNIGHCAGKGLVQLYVTIPGLDFLTLAAYEKSDKLFPGDTENLVLHVRRDQLTVFDKEKESYVIHTGIYEFLLGNSPYEVIAKSGETVVTEEVVVRKCENITESVDERRSRIEANLPDTISTRIRKKITFDEVRAGKYQLDDFIGQLTPEELSDLSRGEGSMDSAYAIKGNAGIFGGITPALSDRGIPVVSTSDGPSGLRISRYNSLLPIGTAIASSWNKQLTEALYRSVAEGMAFYGVDVLLGPAINIQRNPLCGRNYEYYSEDPYLSGMTAVAAVRGIQSLGGSACVKHFACNNQEANRARNSSNVDEKTLREIYLKPFEIVIREAQPKCLMTSYNKVNGIWSHYHYDLVTTVLRKEWGYDGLVMTDWWMAEGSSPEFPQIKDNAYRIRAGVNLLMPGERIRGEGDTVHDADPEHYLTLGELQSNARYILKFILTIR